MADKLKITLVESNVSQIPDRRYPEAESYRRGSGPEETQQDC